MRLTDADVASRTRLRITKIAKGLADGTYTIEDAASAVTEMAEMIAAYEAQKLPHTYVPTTRSGSIVPCAVCGNHSEFPSHQNG